MKGSPRRWLRLAFAVGGCALVSAAAPSAFAAETSAAQLTRVMKRVTLNAQNGTARPAKTGAAVPAGATLRTSAEAQAEVTLPGAVITRLGGKTAVRLTDKGVELAEGLILFQVPERAGGTIIQTGALNLSSRGGTGLIERNGDAYAKVLVLEGEARVFTRRLGESIVMTPGQLLITSPTGEGLPEPVHFAIEHLYKTSLLLNNDFAPLPRREAILRAIQKQKNDPRFIPTNLVIFGRGTLVNLLPPSAKPAASPLPAPRKR